MTPCFDHSTARDCVRETTPALLAARFGKTEELVGAAIYLASDAATFVTGATLVVDGGFLPSGVNQ